MEMIKIPKDEYERILRELKFLREIKNINWDLIKQFKDGLEDIKAGRIRRVA